MGARVLRLRHMKKTLKHIAVGAFLGIFTSLIGAPDWVAWVLVLAYTVWVGWVYDLLLAASAANNSKHFL